MNLPDPGLTRKSFIRRALSTWAAICSLPPAYALFQYIVPPEKVDASPVPIPAGKISGLGPGEVRFFREGKTAFFVRETESGQIRSFSAKCTHLGCIVEYLDGEGKFRCNCHGSLFDADGMNLTGPATRPLQPYRVEVRGDNVFVTML
jgi:cytochrome b6-f complex iron-sulfur subunit